MKLARVEPLKPIRAGLFGVQLAPRHIASIVRHESRSRPAPRSKEARSFRENPQSVAVTIHDAARYSHLLFELGIPSSELVRSLRGFDQKQSVGLGGVQPLEDFSRQDDTQRIAELADFELDHSNYQCDNNGRRCPGDSSKLPKLRI